MNTKHIKHLSNTELIKLAAKAYGRNKSLDSTRKLLKSGWNPLENSSDTFDLQVRLGMNVNVDYAKLHVCVWDGLDEHHYGSLSKDGINVVPEHMSIIKHTIVQAAAGVGFKQKYKQSSKEKE